MGTQSDVRRVMTGPDFSNWPRGRRPGGAGAGTEKALYGQREATHVRIERERDGNDGEVGGRG